MKKMIKNLTPSSIFDMEFCSQTAIYSISTFGRSAESQKIHIFIKIRVFSWLFARQVLDRCRTPAKEGSKAPILLSAMQDPSIELTKFQELSNKAL